MCLPVLCLALVAAPPVSPRAGHYYRAAFVDQVRSGTFDPDTYVAHREPSVRWSFPTATIDFGQEKLELELRYTTTGTTVTLETRRPKDGRWAPRQHQAIDRSRLVTDLLGGGPETLVRLGHDFETLARHARDRNGAALRHRLNGRYVSTSGDAVVIDARATIRKCLESCQRPVPCVELSGVHYRLDGERVLVEVAPPLGLCPDGPAFEPKADGRRFERGR